MGDCFGVILRMSLTASFVIAAVCLVRLLLYRAPRRYSYLLWIIVLVRLLCPSVPEMRFGLVPDMAGLFERQQNAEEPAVGGNDFFAGGNADDMQMPQMKTGNGADVDVQAAAASNGQETGGDRESEAGPGGSDVAGSGREAGTLKGLWRKSDVVWTIFGFCWLCGSLIFLCIGLRGYVRVAKRLRRKERRGLLIEQTSFLRKNKAVRKHKLRVRVVEDAEIGAPFTVGMIYPVICIPAGLSSFQREMVFLHEGVHVRRHDNLLKLLAYILRCIHWFNPLVWLAFSCFEEDMEISCDEAVLRQTGYERRKDYAKTLLALSECGRTTGFYQVSFGRKNTKERICNVLSAKKEGFRIVLVSAAIVAVTSAVLLVDHKPRAVEQEPVQGHIEGDEPTVYAAASLQAGASAAGTNVQGRRTEIPAEEPALQEEMRQKELVDQQETINAILEKMQLEETSLLLADGGISEGEIHLQDSEAYGFYGEMAFETVHLDGVCALLCNPQTNLGRNGAAVEYTHPLDRVDTGSALLTAKYGCRVHPVNRQAVFHSGIDFAAEEGAPVYAAACACVYRTGFDEENGNYVILIHANGELTYYTHCDSINAEAGDVVERGEQIATVGSTGNSTGPHLHFSVSRGGKFIMPQIEGERESVSPDSVVVLPVDVRMGF